MQPALPPPPPRAPLGLTNLINEAPLFESELATVEEAAVAALGRTGEPDVLSLDEVRALHAAAKSGRINAEGPECLVAPTATDAFYAQYPGGKAASLTLQCVGATCRPALSIVRAQGADVTKMLTGENVTAIDAASWRASIEAAAWGEPIAEAVIPGSPDIGQNGPLVARKVACFGACAKPPALSLFAPKLWKECANADVRVLAEFDVTGRSLRCESDACACDGVSRVDLKKADGARRLFVELGDGPGGKSTFGQTRFGGGLVRPFKALRGSVDFVLPAFPHSTRSADIRKELSGCLYTTRTEDSSVAITVTLAANGLIEKFTLGEGHGFTAAEEVCLNERLPKLVSFTCPGVNNSVATTLSIKARKIGPAKKSKP